MNFGLIPALGSLADSYLKDKGINSSIKTTGRVKRLPPGLETAIFRVVQEALNNAVRHAQAKNLEITLNFKKDSIRIAVKDDGIGFDVQKVENSRDWPHGLGLLGMRERIELVNGSLSIKSSPGHGTEIIMDIPLTGVGSNG